MPAGHPARLVVLALVAGTVRGWACCSCGGGGVASNGETCPDCHGTGHHTE